MATDRITAVDHDAIRARHAAARFEPELTRPVDVPFAPHHDDAAAWWYVTDTAGEKLIACRDEAAALFIAHAHQDIPVLLLETERLRAALDYLRRKIDGYDVTFEVAEEIAIGAVSLDGLTRTEPTHG